VSYIVLSAVQLNLNPHRPEVELHSTALSVVAHSLSSLIRLIILSCFILIFENFLLFGDCFSPLKLIVFLENEFGLDCRNSEEKSVIILEVLNIGI